MAYYVSARQCREEAERRLRRKPFTCPHCGGHDKTRIPIGCSRHWKWICRACNKDVY